VSPIEPATFVGASGTVANVSWSAPASNGGSAITYYTVSSNIGGHSTTTTNTYAVVTGLTNGVTYTFTVTATNAIGTSTSSGTSNGVTPATVPSAPLNLAATVRDSSIDLSWSAPASNGGSSLTDYVVEYKLTSGGTWSIFADGFGTTPATTVTSLSNDNSYDFRIYAKNIVGTSTASSVVSATPGAPAQVLIQSFSSLLIPTISTNVRITNEGSTAYEYQYTWCVTDSALNQCGGGDDMTNDPSQLIILEEIMMQLPVYESYANQIGQVAVAEKISTSLKRFERLYNMSKTKLNIPKDIIMEDKVLQTLQEYLRNFQDLPVKHSTGKLREDINRKHGVK
jgi:hypothetical protein